MVAAAGRTPGQPAMWNSFANMASAGEWAVTIVGGEGATVVDDHGNRYLDALASLWYCNVGHGRAELADAVAAQMRQLAAYQTFEPFTNAPAVALAQRIAGHRSRRWTVRRCSSPRRRVRRHRHRSQAGPPLLARGRPGRQADHRPREHAYHGMNAYGTSLGGIPTNAGGFGHLVAAGDGVAERPRGARQLLCQLGADGSLRSSASR